MIRESLAACPEFVFVKEQNTLYCNICIEKEEFEKLQDFNSKPGVINFLGDTDEETVEENDDDADDTNIEKVKVPRIISNLKKKMKFHFDTKAHKSKVIKFENKNKIHDHEAKVEKEAAIRCARICYFLFLTIQI